MNKLIFLILTILIISIKSQYDNEEIRVECGNRNSRGYTCVFYTRNNCCYVTEFCSITKKIYRCEETDVSPTRKQILEYIIKKEIQRYGNNKKKNK